jgi:hypothetical protein
MDHPFPLAVVFVALFLPVLVLVVELAARQPMRKAILDAIPRGSWAALLLALYLPRKTVEWRVAFAVGVVLAAWHVWVGFIKLYRDAKDLLRRRKAAREEGGA